MVIGKGGKAIKEMQSRTHTTMSIQQQGIPDGLPRPLTIIGRKSNVMALCAEIRQMLETAPFGNGMVCICALFHVQALRVTRTNTHIYLIASMTMGVGGVRPQCVEYLPCPKEKVALVIG